MLAIHVCNQKVCFEFRLFELFVSILDLLVQNARLEGHLDSGIVDMKATTVELQGTPKVMLFLLSLHSYIKHVVTSTYYRLFILTTCPGLQPYRFLLHWIVDSFGRYIYYHYKLELDGYLPSLLCNLLFSTCSQRMRCLKRSKRMSLVQLIVDSMNPNENGWENGIFY